MESPPGAPLQSSTTLSPSKPLNDAFSHGSETVRNHRAPPNYDGPGQFPTTFAATQGKRPHHRSAIESYLDPSRLKLQHKHRRSKSRGDSPQKMNGLGTSAGARGLLSTWSGTKERDNGGDDGLLRPKAHETTRSRLGSDSTTGLGAGSRKGSLLDGFDHNQKLVLVKENEIRSSEDLEQVRSRRKQGEGHLRSALLGIGKFATDVTRKLDYTYYSLLEKLAALSSTIALFQELSDSLSTICSDFERETLGLDQDIRKQIRDLRDFQPRVQKIETLEERMRSGKTKAEALGKKLEAIRDEIDRWEKREADWQTQVTRRLRIFWAVAAAGLLTLLIVLVTRNYFTSSAPGLDDSVPATVCDNYHRHTLPNQPGTGHSTSVLDKPAGEEIRPLNQPGCEPNYGSHQTAGLVEMPFSALDAITGHVGLVDPPRRLDEL